MHGVKKLKIIYGISISLSILTLLILIFSLFFPWYFYQIEENGNNKFSLDERYNLLEKKYDIRSEWSHVEWLSYEKAGFQSNYPNFIEIINVLLGAVVISLIISILLIIFLVLSGFENKMYYAVIVLCILLFTFTLFNSIYMMVALPDAFKKDLDAEYDPSREDYRRSIFYKSESIDPSPSTQFTGKSNANELSASWGPDVGWYLMILAFIFSFINLIFAFYFKKRKAIIFRQNIKFELFEN